jgi:glycosyltransferase involved in cell wall biosynthesis
VTEKPTLVFISTRFLFPVDSGGKIRTTQILRGLKGGKFRIVLASPATETQIADHSAELETVSDAFEYWQQPSRGSLFKYTRMRFLPGPLPISVRSCRHSKGIEMISRLIDDMPDVAVFDFAHAGVLAPSSLPCASVMFTHNVEAEIFRRHHDTASSALNRAIWGNQYRKMRDFEAQSLQRFDVVVAVAERDKERFVRDYEINEPFVIPTGVDLDFFSFEPPLRESDIVFIGSMDWMANQEGVAWFMDHVWKKIVECVPDCRMTVVGRAPPISLVKQAQRRDFNWRFTGFVEDVRPYVHGAAVAVIPLNVGGGTRLKAYESMAMGCPIVSTSIGMEGLPAEAGQHYLRADSPADFAAAVVCLLKNREKRSGIAERARDFVEQNCSYVIASRAFEAACELAMSRHVTTRNR